MISDSGTRKPQHVLQMAVVPCTTQYVQIWESSTTGFGLQTCVIERDDASMCVNNMLPSRVYGFSAKSVSIVLMLKKNHGYSHTQHSFSASIEP